MLGNKEVKFMHTYVLACMQIYLCSFSQIKHKKRTNDARIFNFTLASKQIILKQ